MKYSWIILLFASLIWGCATTAGSTKVEKNAKEFCEDLQNIENIQLIDVRTPEEYAQQHIQHAELIDFNQKEEFLQSIEKLNKQQPVYLYCRSGRRSGLAADILAEKGFKTIVDLHGGILAWNAEKHHCQ